MKPAYDRMKAIADEENIIAFNKMVEEAKLERLDPRFEK